MNSLPALQNRHPAYQMTTTCSKVLFSDKARPDRTHVGLDPEAIPPMDADIVVDLMQQDAVHSEILISGQISSRTG